MHASEYCYRNQSNNCVIFPFEAKTVSVMQVLLHCLVETRKYFGLSKNCICYCISYVAQVHNPLLAYCIIIQLSERFSSQFSCGASAA